MEAMKERKREVWIDDVKVVACVLVLLGYLMQSMTSSNIVPANGIYEWFDKTIYYFHVPLFFICSGYLYQKLSTVNSFDAWSRNVLKKFITLGVPYITFTVATWLLKTLTGGGHSSIDNIFETLFFQPTSPYWFYTHYSLCF